MNPRGSAPATRLGRSSHTAFLDDDKALYVWGGCQAVAGGNSSLPSDEIWLCHLDTMTWERREVIGEAPPELSGFCGSHLKGTLYIFGGCDAGRYTSEMFSVDLAQRPPSWRRVTDAKGATPSPRSRHSCWAHGGRLIYFGGYGCRTMAQNTSSRTFTVEEMSWKTIGDALYRCWGWNNEVNVFDTRTATWSAPDTQGPAPSPRGCHASAVLGGRGFISGGLKMAELDMFCLDFATWTWTHFDTSAPLGRSMFTMTPISDHTLFIYGGLGTNGCTLNEAWQFDTLKSEWTRRTHPHGDKPRVCHTACRGGDGDVVVFGGSSNVHILDLEAVLRAPLHRHYSEVFVFQTQPYPLFRLCRDFVRRDPGLFGTQLDLLPSNLRSKVLR